MQDREGYQRSEVLKTNKQIFCTSISSSYMFIFCSFSFRDPYACLPPACQTAGLEVSSKWIDLKSSERPRVETSSSANMSHALLHPVVEENMSRKATRDESTVKYYRRASYPDFTQAKINDL